MRKLFQFIKNKFVNIFNFKNDDTTENIDTAENRIDEKSINSSTINLSITNPSVFEDVLEACNKIYNGEVVCVNINYVEDGTQQRIVDFLSGFCFTVNASFNEATKHIFMLIPENLEEKVNTNYEERTFNIV